MGRGMKNKIKSIFKILTVAAGCLMFASFSPSLDGRAVVVDNGVFPQGLFAKTVGYLPGDIISVTNIAGDRTIDLLVIGALDPSEGVAIMLSPEAADAMGIDRGANNIVKITKRSGQDERVYGNAVISKSAAEIEDWDDGSFENISAEEKTEAFDDTTEAVAEPAEKAPEEAVLTDTADEFAEPEDFAEEDFEEADFEEPAVEEETEESFDEPAETIEASEMPEEAENFEENEAIEENFDEETLPEEEFTDEEPEAFEETVEEEAFDAEELPENEEVPAETAPEEAAEEEAFIEEEEAPEEEAFDSEELEALPEESTEEFAEAPAEESFEEEAPEESFDEEAFSDENPEELPEEEKAEEFEEAPAEEAFVEDELEDLPEESEAAEDAESEEYAAIVLVPADSNPPEGDSDEVEDVISEDELDSIDEEITLKPLPSEDNISLSVENTVNIEETKPAGNATSYDKYIVPSLNQLESGKYYIQIAAYGSDENILEVINKYGSNYPITIVPMAGGKTKQVLIGPVTMDEYKVVLERFKSYGFKDAFLRKIK